MCGDKAADEGSGVKRCDNAEGLNRNACSGISRIWFWTGDAMRFGKLGGRGYYFAVRHFDC